MTPKPRKPRKPLTVLRDLTVELSLIRARGGWVVSELCAASGRLLRELRRSLKQTKAR